MEPLFVNDYILSDEDINNRIGLPIRIWAGVLFVFSIMMASVYFPNALENGKDLLFLVVWVILAVCSFFLPTRVKRWAMKLVRAQALTLGIGEYRQRRVEFFEDHFSTFSGSTFHYDQISRVSVKRHGISIRIKKLFGSVYLRMDSFTKGDSESFLAFLAQKGVSVPKRFAGSGR